MINTEACLRAAPIGIHSDGFYGSTIDFSSGDFAARLRFAAINEILSSSYKWHFGCHDIHEQDVGSEWKLGHMKHAGGDVGHVH